MARILIADDQPDLLLILSARLRATGFEVIEACNGNEALEVVRQESLDVIVLDVMMPELNGYQVCKKVKEDPRTQGVPVILLTAKTNEADRFWGSEVGADLYLTKPIDPADVVKHIETILEVSSGQ